MDKDTHHPCNGQGVLTVSFVSGLPIIDVPFPKSLLRDAIERSLEASGVVFDVAESQDVPVATLYENWTLRPHTCLWMTQNESHLHVHFAINLFNAHWHVTAGKIVASLKGFHTLRLEYLTSLSGCRFSLLLPVDHRTARATPLGAHSKMVDFNGFSFLETWNDSHHSHLPRDFL